MTKKRKIFNYTLLVGLLILLSLIALNKYVINGGMFISQSGPDRVPEPYRNNDYQIEVK